MVRERCCNFVQEKPPGALARFSRNPGWDTTNLFASVTGAPGSRVSVRRAFRFPVDLFYRKPVQLLPLCAVPRLSRESEGTRANADRFLQQLSAPTGILFWSGETFVNHGPKKSLGAASPTTAFPILRKKQSHLFGLRRRCQRAHHHQAKQRSDQSREDSIPLRQQGGRCRLTTSHPRRK
jgi:hypothetical protein